MSPRFRRSVFSCDTKRPVHDHSFSGRRQKIPAPESPQSHISLPSPAGFTTISLQTSTAELSLSPEAEMALPLTNARASAWPATLTVNPVVAPSLAHVWWAKGSELDTTCPEPVNPSGNKFLLAIHASSIASTLNQFLLVVLHSPKRRIKAQSRLHPSWLTPMARLSSVPHSCSALSRRNWTILLV